MQNNKKLGINSAEHISFLNEKNQIRIAEIIQNSNEIICFYSDNDPYVKYEVEKEFADKISNKR